MPDAADAPALDWLVPVAVAVGVTILVVVALVLVVRRARRSPRARAAAGAARTRAGESLVLLDDAVDQLDLEMGLSGALRDGAAPTTLRRARMTAQHARDEAFAQFGALSDPVLLPGEVRRRAARIDTRAAGAVAAITHARTEHGAWVAANVPPANQVTAARVRLAELRQSMGDPDALIQQLSDRFEPSEWQDAATAAADARTAVDEAETRLEAAGRAGDSRAALPDLAAAERALRRAQRDARTLEETHRVVLQAAEALPGEFDAARQAVQQAAATAPRLRPDAAERLSDEVRAVEASLTASQTDAARRPTATVDQVARLRDRLDAALGDARSAQQRMRGARTALPGTLAAARVAVAHAEASVLQGRSGADARVRLAAAQQELAAARNSPDPVAALATARRAIAAAEDARALADEDRLTPR